MDPSSDDELIEVWLRYDRAQDPADFWARDRVNTIVHDDPKRAWHLICGLVGRASDDQLGSIGVGPIEDLVHEHHAAVIDKIAKEARRDVRFRAALTWMWFTRGSMPPHVERQLLEVTNHEMRVL
jgi:hypothetical protein